MSNTDDHLRNHGFILVLGKGSRLSPGYDMNPVPESQGLKLNVSEDYDTMDLDLARSVALYFRVPKRHLRPCELQHMAAAFRLAD